MPSVVLRLELFLYPAGRGESREGGVSASKRGSLGTFRGGPFARAFPLPPYSRDTRERCTRVGQGLYSHAAPKRSPFVITAALY